MALIISIPKPRPATELPTDATPDVGMIMEKYPRIGNRISMLWGSVELQKYLNDLICDGRADRQGFPPTIAAALMRIHKDHGKLVPENDKGAWSNTFCC
jgi:hypothetical protein